MKLKYCCKWPNLHLFKDSHGEKETAVVHCSSCQRIAGEIWLSTGKTVEWMVEK